MTEQQKQDAAIEQALACGVCGSPQEMHRHENLAHHSECTLQTYTPRLNFTRDEAWQCAEVVRGLMAWWKKDRYLLWNGETPKSPEKAEGDKLKDPAEAKRVKAHSPAYGVNSKGNRSHRKVAIAEQETTLPCIGEPQQAPQVHQDVLEPMA